jgi:hypothetical protein
MLERSCPHPLSITIVNRPSAEAKPLDRNAPFLRFVLEFRAGLKHLVLDVCHSGLLRDAIPVLQPLPVLRALKIHVVREDHRGISPPRLLDLFQCAPSLRTLELDAPTGFIRTLHTTRFPWFQLSFSTMLFINIPSFHAVLGRCRSLEAGYFHKLDVNFSTPGIPHPPCALNNLRSLDLRGMSGAPVPGFSDSSTFPRLTRLRSDGLIVPVQNLLDFHVRCQFNLEQLELELCFFPAADVLQLLHVTPSLRTLSIRYFDSYEHPGNGNDVLNIFRSPAESLLLLPHLENLLLTEESSCLDEYVISEFANSLWQYTSEGSSFRSAFPSLTAVHLYLIGPKFSAAVEEILAVVCSTTR